MKVGDLVRVIEDDRFDDSGDVGVVHWVNFDDRFRGEAGVFINGAMEVYACKWLEVVSESR